MNAHILSIGNELTIGQTVDTNSAWLAQRLAERGILCTRHVTVADERAGIAREIAEAARQAEIVLITGGLGPTPDDLTREALADAMGVPLEFHPAQLEQIAAYFRQRRRPMHEKNRVQAMLPSGAEAMENTCGTAPGIIARVDRAQVFVMPGVPNEMKVMFERSVLPRLPTGGGESICQRTLRSIAMPEAEVGDRIADLMARGRNPTVGTSAADLIISIRINAHGTSEEGARSLAEADAAEIRQRLGTAIFGDGDDTLADAVSRLLIARRETISSAESCTGGLIAKCLTDVPGSSVYLLQGFVTYSNDSKVRLLGIPLELIEHQGAVSAEVAEALAANCRRLSGTTYALSATGIAGPTGGTPTKPVGLVYVGLATPSETIVKELRLGETLTREEVRDRTAKAALNLLRLNVLESQPAR